VATLNLDYFNSEHKTLAILGKGNRFRLIELEPKTTQLLQLYIARFRPPPSLSISNVSLSINAVRNSLATASIASAENISPSPAA